MENIRQDQEGAAATTEQRKALSVELVGEAILLLFVTVFFGYIIADSVGLIGGPWPIGAALTPWIAVGIGIPFLAIRIVHVFRVALWVERKPRISQAQIMDVGFRIGEDPAAERQRFVRILIAILALYFGVWLVGFHIMVPLWVFGYMCWYGNARIVTAGIIALLFLALIFGVYDTIMQTPWHEPVLFRLFS